MKRDTWATDAAQRLRQHLMRGTLAGKNYAPDQTYELSKRGQVGPLSAGVAKIFQQHADVWAEDMREAASLRIAVDLNATWSAAMLEADQEIDRYLAGHKLGHGAAA